MDRSPERDGAPSKHTYNAKDDLMHVLLGKTGNALNTWLQYFDGNGDAKIDREEFTQAMLRLGFPGNADDLFDEIDQDQSGFITIEELDPWSSQLWTAFKRWCVHTFSSKEDLVTKLRRMDVHGSGQRRAGAVEVDRRQSTTPAAAHTPSHASHASASTPRKSVAFVARVGTVAEDRRLSARPSVKGPIGVPFDAALGITKEQFKQNASRLGWYGSMEDMLFGCMDPEGSGLVTVREISAWFDEELEADSKRMHIKLRRQKSGGSSINRARSACQHALKAFKEYLRGRWKYFFHAWRDLLDRDGSMCVARKEVFKACADLGWHGDVAALWQALDTDTCGTCSLDELALAEARVLALFRKEAQDRWGSVLKHFRAMCKRAGVRGPGSRLTKTAWVDAGTSLGCQYNLPLVFELLDWECEGSLCLRDIRCIDQWSPPFWLSAPPDSAAAEDFKRVLLKKYRSPVRAWRQALDLTDSGRATYKEFQSACEKIGFSGNMGGAFLALDRTCDGAIQLEEVDDEVAAELRRFRHWANQVFGSVQLAFEELDTDHSSTLSRREFRKAVKDHHYKGDIGRLFDSLDTDGGGQIGRPEIIFLDDWCEPISVHEGEEAHTRLGMVAAPEETVEMTAKEASVTTETTVVEDKMESAPNRQRRGLPPAWAASPVKAALALRREAAPDAEKAVAKALKPRPPPEPAPIQKLASPQLLALVGWVSGDGVSLEWAKEVRSVADTTTADLLGPSPPQPPEQRGANPAAQATAGSGRRKSGAWGAAAFTGAAVTGEKRPNDDVPGPAYPLAGWAVYGRDSEADFPSRRPASSRGGRLLPSSMGRTTPSLGRSSPPTGPATPRTSRSGFASRAPTPGQRSLSSGRPGASATRRPRSSAPHGAGRYVGGVPYSVPVV